MAATAATFIDAPGPRRAGKVRETEHRQSAIMHTMLHRKDAVDDAAQRIDISQWAEARQRLPSLSGLHERPPMVNAQPRSLLVGALQCSAWRLTVASARTGAPHCSPPSESPVPKDRYCVLLVRRPIHPLRPTMQTSSLPPFGPKRSWRAS